MEDWGKKSLELHRKKQGKISIQSRVPLRNKDDLSTAYTPGVAAVASLVANDPKECYQYTMKSHSVAIVSDGTAVLGLGNIGPFGALPVMEGKAILLKKFAGIDAFPLCVNVHTPDEIIAFCKAIEPTFGAIMLEDIAAPACVEIERRLEKELNIPVFHDDQHGTAIVVAAALINVSRLQKRALSTYKVVISGTGAAGSSVCRMLKAIGITQIRAYNKLGVVSTKKYSDYDFVVRELLDEQIIQPFDQEDSLQALLTNQDVFIGVSAPNIVREEMVRQMAPHPIIFAMANPSPEIDPHLAKKANAFIVGTGRSDYPNQINNVLIFPGLMKGALKAKAQSITMDMKIAAAKALAYLIQEEELSVEYIVPNPFDLRVSKVVSNAVRKAYLEKK
ncbi:MAG: NADP-dependent malic enzyme [bacterium]|nr:NADP-dependent malic enzyme [bacterium]